jgi:hypothetical protein
MDQVNREILSKLISTLRKLQKVAIKLTLLKIEPIPAICRLKMLKSILFPLCPRLLLRGGYRVQPTPLPPSQNMPVVNRITEGGSTQKLKLFRRGNIISKVNLIRGSIQLPNPPMATGITKKKIIKIA